jgi:hypothetical protein
VFGGKATDKRYIYKFSLCFLKADYKTCTLFYLVSHNIPFIGGIEAIDIPTQDMPITRIHRETIIR